MRGSQTEPLQSGLYQKGSVHLLRFERVVSEVMVLLAALCMS